MSKFFSFLLMMALISGNASASVFVWKDKTSGFTVAFPDTWTEQTQDIPGTRLRIASAIGEDFATCRVRAEKDGRLKIYPQDLMGTAVRETLNRRFWENEVAQYKQATITDYGVAKKSGEVDAVAIKTSFVQDNGHGQMMNMYGSMIATIYGDMRYVISCSSRQEEYQKYAKTFSGIMASMELDSRYHPFATGYYRNFLADPKLMLPRTKPGTTYPPDQYYIPSGL